MAGRELTKRLIGGEQCADFVVSAVGSDVLYARPYSSYSSVAGGNTVSTNYLMAHDSVFHRNAMPMATRDPKQTPARLGIFFRGLVFA